MMYVKTSEKTGEVLFDMDITTLKDSDLVAAYRRLRERKEQENKLLKQKLQPVEDLMGKIEGEARRRMIDRGSDSFKTEAGTCFTTAQVSVTVKDKQAFFDYLRENDAWELADIRAAKKEVENFAESSGGDLPPGVDMNKRLVAQFRAPTNK